MASVTHTLIISAIAWRALWQYPVPLIAMRMYVLRDTNATICSRHHAQQRTQHIAHSAQQLPPLGCGGGSVEVWEGTHPCAWSMPVFHASKSTLDRGLA